MPAGRSHDVVVVGGGTSGAALAGLLAETDQVDVLLIEAGPDYGPRLDDAWPADLLDAAGRIRGIDGLRVCDASILATLPRANTNLPAAMVAEQIAEMMRRGQ